MISGSEIGYDDPGHERHEITRLLLVSSSLRSFALRSIERHDYFRGATFLPSPERALEWSHLCMSWQGTLLLVNFSMEKDHAHVVVLHRSEARGPGQEAWRGTVESRPLHECRLQGHHLQIGEQHWSYSEDKYHLELNVGWLKARIACSPFAVPYFANNARLGRDRTFQWFVAPRLIANGRIEVEGHGERVVAAPSYHDHNWGQFGWHDDFSWEWGYSLFDTNLTAVFVRTGDRGRHATFAQALLLWDGERLVRAFRDEELRVERSGQLRQRRLRTVPAFLELVRPGTATDVPERLWIEARANRDHLELEFRSQDLMQIATIGDVVERFVAINETYGQLHLRGTFHGAALNATGAANFEFFG